MDRYFVINDYSKSNLGMWSQSARVGIYDKWLPTNGNWKPDVIPEQPDRKDDAD